MAVGVHRFKRQLSNYLKLGALTTVNLKTNSDLISSLSGMEKLSTTFALVALNAMIIPTEEFCAETKSEKILRADFFSTERVIETNAS